MGDSVNLMVLLVDEIEASLNDTHKTVQELKSAARLVIAITHLPDIWAPFD